MNLARFLALSAFLRGGSGSGGTGGGSSGSGGAQPDWNAAEGEAGHVLNRTHYAESILDITHDGDITGRPNLALSALGWNGGYIVKVSDLTPTNEELIGSKMLRNDGLEFTLIEDDIAADMFPGARAILPNRGNGTYLMGAVIDSVETTESAIGLPPGTLENGVYFTTWPEDNVCVCQLEKDTFVKKIPEKYLPKTNYIIKLSEGEFDHTSTEQHQEYMCAESYDNFADILWNGGTVWIDVATGIEGMIMRLRPAAWNWVPNLGIILSVFEIVSADGTEGSYKPVQIMFAFTNGTWTPPTT